MGGGEHGFRRLWLSLNGFSKKKSTPLKARADRFCAIWKSSAASNASVGEIKGRTGWPDFLGDSFRFLAGCILGVPQGLFSKWTCVAVGNVVKFILYLLVVPYLFFPRS